jgi:hypothetical protein
MGYYLINQYYLSSINNGVNVGIYKCLYRDLLHNMSIIKVTGGSGYNAKRRRIVFRTGFSH